MRWVIAVLCGIIAGLAIQYSVGPSTAAQVVSAGVAIGVAWFVAAGLR